MTIARIIIYFLNNRQKTQNAPALTKLIAKNNILCSEHLGVSYCTKIDYRGRRGMADQKTLMNASWKTLEFSLPFTLLRSISIVI